MKDRGKQIFVNICCCIALILVLLPLLMVAKYNLPSADDWSYGAEAYQAVQAGAGIGDVLRISVRTVVKNYKNWEGRFMNAFLATLQPGIWGESCYGVVAWIMLGGLVFGELFLIRLLFRGKKGQNRFLWFPMIAPSLTLQILYTPCVVESFYWYTGAVNYTFVYGLSMILIGLFIKLGFGDWTGWRFGIAAAVAGVLAIIVGGDNYSTSLSSLLFVTTCYLGLLVPGKRNELDGETVSIFQMLRRVLGRTWYVMVLMGGSLLVSVLAPGNRMRLESNFGGATTGNAVEAVFMSLVRSATNIYSWTNIKIILMLLLIAPFVWRAVSDMDYDFRLPGIFTLISFGVYASQIAPTMYVDGTTGGGRMAAILYYSYHMWLVGNLIYWLGWLCRRRHVFAEKLSGAVALSAGRFLLPYCLVLGMILAGVAYRFDLKELSSYKAYRDWRQGWAQQYAAEWAERLEALHDESLTQVEFVPLSVCPETILYTDLQDEYGYIWVNKACARYYGKKSVRIVRQETGD